MCMALHLTLLGNANSTAAKPGISTMPSSCISCDAWHLLFATVMQERQLLMMHHDWLSHSQACLPDSCTCLADFDTCPPFAGASEADQQDVFRQAAAARVTVLAVTLLTAFAVHSANDKEVKVKDLTQATWRVSQLPCQLLLSM